MVTGDQTTATTAGREFRLTRLFDAPRETVFEAFTDAEQIGNWWGPRGFRTTTHSMDVAAGGQWRFVMHGPDGTDYDNVITYREVVAPERLVYDHAGGEDEPGPHFLVTVTFEAEGDKTRLTMLSLFDTEAEREQVVREAGAIEGGKQTLERLAEHLASL